MDLGHKNLEEKKDQELLIKGIKQEKRCRYEANLRMGSITLASSTAET